MALIDGMLQELDLETQTTRRVLERVPNDHLSWRPHAKARTLGQLALHVATVPGGVAELASRNPAQAPDFADPSPSSASELVAALERSIASAKKTLGGMDDAALMATWRLMRGDREVLEEARSLGGAAVERATARLGETLSALEARGAADRVRIDLGLLRDLGYYSGAILEVYDPALGHVLGGGGRYDRLLKRFGLDLPAAGFALYLERVHIAQMEEESRRAGR